MTDKQKAKRELELCEEALQLPENDRSTFLLNACPDDEPLRASVQSLLHAICSSGDFLELNVDHTAADQLTLGRRVGNYALLKNLGEGGMGAVYLAARDDGEFDQLVAVKLMHGHLLAGELTARFNAERKILASLNHPYIASVIDGGTTEDGIPYLVMEYIDGLPIGKYCDDKTLGIRERVTLLQKVAVAVDAAHRNLVVHRDLKPSNVLVTVDGIPKLLDFGIAKLVRPSSAVTADPTVNFDNVAVTPDYASPEQVLENTVTTVSDVYSLGVLAYELLTGLRPYHIKCGSHLAVITAMQSVTVPRPSTQVVLAGQLASQQKIATARSTSLKKLKRRLQGDLDNILLKALQRDPAHRYQSVAQFSSDFENYLCGLPVTAHADSVGYRLGKLIKRNWLATAAASLMLLSLVVGLFITQQQRDIARREADRASKVTAFLEEVLMAPSAVSGVPIVSGQNASVRDVIYLAGERVEQAFPGEPEIQAQLYATLAQAHRGLGNWDEALSLSEKALTNLGYVYEQSEVQATVRMAHALIQFHAPDGNIQKVRSSLIEAEQFAVRSPGVPSKLHAKVLHLLGQTEPDGQSMERVMRAAGEEWLEAGGNPTDDLLATVHYKLGQIRVGQGRFEEADVELQQAIDILDGEGEKTTMELGFAHEMLGVSKTRRGEYALARDHLTRALNILEQSAARNPWLVVTYSYLSETARLEGNLYEAQQHLDTAGQIGRSFELIPQAPHWMLLANQQAELDLMRGDFLKVSEQLTAMLNQVKPSTMLGAHRAKSLYLIALAHANLGEMEAARLVGSEGYRGLVNFYGQSNSTAAVRTRLEAAGIELHALP